MLELEGTLDVTLMMPISIVTLKKKKALTENSFVVQWLGLSTFTAGTWV